MFFFGKGMVYEICIFVVGWVKKFGVIYVDLSL